MTNRLADMRLLPPPSWPRAWRSTGCPPHWRRSERDRSNTRRLHLIGLALLAATSTVAGQTAQDPPRFRSGVDLIEVDVNVLDDDGLPIPDLDGEEFTVSVDGEPRRVVQAQFIALSSRARDARPAALARTYTSNSAEPPGRLIVMAVDDESILFGGGRDVMRAAAAFVDGLMPADRVALRTVPSGVSIDFTADHARVRRALEGMGGIGDRLEHDGISVSEAFDIARHPNICTIHEINETADGQLYLVMAHYEGETLKERTGRRPLPLDDAIDRRRSRFLDHR